MAHNHGRASVRHRGRLFFVLALTSAFMVVEATAGFLSGSLVLVADAGHMLTDVAGLSLALVAIWFAGRPANARKTYGYYRAEVLAAVVNALLLFGVSGFIFIEGFQRLRSPSDVASTPLILVASIALVVNLVDAGVLMQGARESMNVRGAFLEVVGDVLGSLGAIAAGVVLLLTGWRYADPVFAMLVGVLILPRTWSLLKGALDVLFEGMPAHVQMTDVQQAILAVPGVWSVHDLHVWTVTSGFVALSGHVEVAEGVDRDEVLVRLRSALHAQFEISHVTIQVENERLAHELDQECFPGQEPRYTHPPHPSQTASTP